MVGLEEKQVRRATAALLKYVKSSADVGKASLMDDEGEVILAQLSLHKIPGNVTTKPIQIAIPHPMRNRDDCDMCLFVKDNAKGWIKEMMDKEPVEGLTKIIELQKIRSQYREFKDRRQLVSQFDLFLADDRILPMLTKTLGKTFLSAKRQPVPVRLDRKSSLAGQISRARDSAYLCGSYGDCWAVKLANTAMTEDQTVDNLMAGIAAVVDKIPKKWKNVKAINIKSTNSVALPVYSDVGDIPAAPPSTIVTTKGGAEEAETKGKAEAQHKPRKPRPLIRKQLNKLKEEAKAEKALDSAKGTAGGKVQSKKRPAAEIARPDPVKNKSDEKVASASGGKSNVQAKRKSPMLDNAEGQAAGAGVKAGKRRRAAVS